MSTYEEMRKLGNQFQQQLPSPYFATLTDCPSAQCLRVVPAGHFTPALVVHSAAAFNIKLFGQRTAERIQSTANVANAFGIYFDVISIYL
jgi:hypothetical protein